VKRSIQINVTLGAVNHEIDNQINTPLHCSTCRTSKYLQNCSECRHFSYCSGLTMGPNYPMVINPLVVFLNKKTSTFLFFTKIIETH